MRENLTIRQGSLGYFIHDERNRYLSKNNRLENDCGNGWYDTKIDAVAALHTYTNSSTTTTVSTDIKSTHKTLSREKEKGSSMEELDLRKVSRDAEDFDEYETVVTLGDAETYAEKVATEALKAYIAQSKTESNSSVQAEKGSTMAPGNEELKKAAQEVLSESEVSAAIITGEILLDNIETLADKLVLSRLNWWQKLTLNKNNKELLVTIATYGIVYAIKSGGFGLTKYRIDHKVIDFITLAANQRIMKAVVKSTGVDTNVAAMLLAVPTVAKED